MNINEATNLVKAAMLRYLGPTQAAKVDWMTIHRYAKALVKEHSKVANEHTTNPR